MLLLFADSYASRVRLRVLEMDGWITVHAATPRDVRREGQERPPGETYGQDISGDFCSANPTRERERESSLWPGAAPFAASAKATFICYLPLPAPRRVSGSRGGLLFPAQW